MNSLQNRSTLLDKQYDTGQFSACIVTNIGKEMIAKSQNGHHHYVLQSGLQLQSK